MMINKKTRKIFPLFLFFVLLGCGEVDTTPVFPTSPALTTSTVQSTGTPTSTPWPTPTFLIPSATEIVVEEKQPNPNEWMSFGGNKDTQVGEIDDIAFGADGSVWFASIPGGLIKYKDGEWKSFNPQ